MGERLWPTVGAALLTATLASRPLSLLWPNPSGWCADRLSPAAVTSVFCTLAGPGGLSCFLNPILEDLLISVGQLKS